MIANGYWANSGGSSPAGGSLSVPLTALGYRTISGIWMVHFRTLPDGNCLGVLSLQENCSPYHLDFYPQTLSDISKKGLPKHLDGLALTVEDFENLPQLLNYEVKQMFVVSRTDFGDIVLNNDWLQEWDTTTQKFVKMNVVGGSGSSNVVKMNGRIFGQSNGLSSDVPSIVSASGGPFCGYNGNTNFSGLQCFEDCVSGWYTSTDTTSAEYPLRWSVPSPSHRPFLFSPTYPLDGHLTTGLVIYANDYCEGVENSNTTKIPVINKDTSEQTSPNIKDTTFVGLFMQDNNVVWKKVEMPASIQNTLTTHGFACIYKTIVLASNPFFLKR